MSEKELFVGHLGELKGKKADWLTSFKDSESGFHAVEFENRYECHIDKKDPLGHLIDYNLRTLFRVGLLLIGAFVMYTFFRKIRSLKYL
ncbi:MAG: hypothetical protein QXU18_11815 [Thermoplasmatales archaeon]